MAAETEASCLLRSGNLYPRRIGLRSADGSIVFAGIKRGAFSLYFDDEPIYHFDLEGRWQRAFLRGEHFKKALDQSVDLIGREKASSGMTLRRAARSRAEIVDLDETIRAAALDLSEGLVKRLYELQPPPPSITPLPLEDLHAILERIASWDAAAWFARREDFVRVYGAGFVGDRRPLVPPDSQNAIVLNPFRDGDEAAIAPDEFAAHCGEVEVFLGLRAIQAGSAFLAGAGALRRSVEEVAANLEAIAESFPIRDTSRPSRPGDLPSDRPSLSGIDACFDAWSDGPPLPDAAGWRELAARKMRRVTASFLLEGSRHAIVATIADAKAAGVAVSAIVPYGVGDDGLPDAAADAINGLPLGRGDFVHLVDGSDLPATTCNHSGREPTGEEVARRRDGLSKALEPARSRGVKVTNYDPSKQWF